MRQRTISIGNDTALEQLQMLADVLVKAEPVLQVYPSDVPPP